MKKRLLLLFMLICPLLCKAETKDKIEIIYLTANAYCPSVEQIENEAKKVIDSLYVNEKKNGTIIESKLNIMEEKNQDFIHKWEISTNGLIFLVTRNGITEKVDLNDFAFSNVPSDIPFFKEGLAKNISTILSRFNSQE